MPRPAWFTRGLKAGRLSRTVHSSASIKCDRVSGRFWLIVVGLEPGDLGVSSAIDRRSSVSDVVNMASGRGRLAGVGPQRLHCVADLPAPCDCDSMPWCTVSSDRVTDCTGSMIFPSFSLTWATSPIRPLTSLRNRSISMVPLATAACMSRTIRSMSFVERPSGRRADGSLGDDPEATARLARLLSLDRGVDREEIGLFRHLRDRGDHRRDPAGPLADRGELSREGVHRLVEVLHRGSHALQATASLLGHLGSLAGDAGDAAGRVEELFAGGGDLRDGGGDLVGRSVHAAHGPLLPGQRRCRVGLDGR